MDIYTKERIIRIGLHFFNCNEYNDKCRASEDFKSLVSEILSRIENVKKL